MPEFNPSQNVSDVKRAETSGHEIWVDMASN